MIRRSIQRLTPYTPGEQPQGGNVIKLNTNENPYPPSPKVLRALRQMNGRRLRLYPDPLAVQLRRRIASLHGCDLGNVFAGNGSDEILTLCVRAFVENDGAVGYFYPSYSLYPVLAGIRGLKARSVELAQDFGWRTPKGGAASLFLMTNPNAPTGIRYPPETVKRFCRKFRGVVVIDEAYVDFSDGNCARVALELNNTIIVRTLSKAYSLAGLRVGYAIGSKRLIATLFKIKDSYNVDMISQRLALAALNDVGYMRRMVRKIRATRTRLARALSKMGHIVYPSETNFLWAQPCGMTARTLFSRLRRQKIMVRHFPGRRTEGFVRITVGTDAEVNTLIRAMKGMGR